MEPLFGNDKFARAMDKHVGHRKRHRVSGQSRWKHFRRYFTLSDFRENPKDSQRTNLLWKVQTLLDELNAQASRMWVPGKFLAVDEQTIGFQGASGFKVRITYKREGDGFQCEAICDHGYTYAFWFRCAKLLKFLQSTNIMICLLRQSALFGWLSNCQIVGRESTWIICSTPTSSSRRFIKRRRWVMVW